MLMLAAWNGSADEESASDPDDEYPLVTYPSQPDGRKKPSATEVMTGVTCERIIVPSPGGPQELVSRRHRV